MVEQVPKVKEYLSTFELFAFWKSDSICNYLQVPGVFLRQPFQPDNPLPDCCCCVEEMCKEFACREREMEICSRDCARVQLPPIRKDEKDHEAHTESLILQRDTMRHLTDWFYPDGGWGWTVVVVAVLINLLTIGPLLGGGQVDD